MWRLVKPEMLDPSQFENIRIAILMVLGLWAVFLTYRRWTNIGYSYNQFFAATTCVAIAFELGAIWAPALFITWVTFARPNKGTCAETKKCSGVIRAQIG